jgi:hypothetical protein
MDKSHQSLPLKFIASYPSSSYSNWQNHLLLGHSMTLFTLNLNSNILLGIKPAYDDTVAFVV